MKLFRSGVVALLVLFLWDPASAGFPSGRVRSDVRRFRALARDDLKDVLRRAGAWVQQFADDAVYVVADERYVQEYRAGESVERRELLSEIVFVRTPEEEVRAGRPWVQFRDVVEVDGAPLPDHRGRLQRLFEESGGSQIAQAGMLVAESARYNIGPAKRNVNVPSFALFFLYPGNQRRFRFRVGQVGQAGQVGADSGTGEGTVIVEYREHDRPTMILTPRRKDLPSSGLFWIDPTSGRVLKTRLEARPDPHWMMTADVTYGQDAGIDAWVPQTMREHFADPAPARQGAESESLDCTATYSNYRRFRTSGRLIVK